MHRTKFSAILTSLAVALSALPVHSLQAKSPARSRCTSQYSDDSDSVRVDMCNEAIRKASKDGDLYYWRGIAKMRMGKNDEGTEDVKECIKLRSPKCQAFFYYRAVVREENGDYINALADFKNHKEIGGNDPDVSSRISELERVLSRDSQKQQEYEQRNEQQGSQSALTAERGPQGRLSNQATLPTQDRIDFTGLAKKVYGDLSVGIRTISNNILGVVLEGVMHFGA